MAEIKLTDKQYETLVKLSFIGEWVLNAQSVSIEFEEEHKLVNYLYSKCSEFNLENRFNKIRDEWELKENAVNDILPIIDTYTHNDFWGILIDKLAVRDSVKEFNENSETALQDEEYIVMLEKNTDKYLNECQLNGVKNLRINNIQNN